MGSRLRTNHLYRLSALRGVCACVVMVGGGVCLPPAEGALWGLYGLKKWSRKDSSEGRVLCFHSGVSVGVGGRREEWPQHLLLSGVFNWWSFLGFGMYIMFFYFVNLNWKYVNAIQSFSSFLFFFTQSLFQYCIDSLFQMCQFGISSDTVSAIYCLSECTGLISVANLNPFKMS